MTRLVVTAARRHEQCCVEGGVDAHQVEERHKHGVDHEPVLLPDPQDALEEDGVAERRLVRGVHECVHCGLGGKAGGRVGEGRAGMSGACDYRLQQHAEWLLAGANSVVPPPSPIHRAAMPMDTSSCVWSCSGSCLVGPPPAEARGTAALPRAPCCRDRHPPAADARLRCTWGAACGRHPASKLRPPCSVQRTRPYDEPCAPRYVG